MPTAPTAPTVQAGHRLLEWIGQPSVLDDPVVEYRLATGGYTPAQAAMVREAAKRRIRRTPGVSRRLPHRGHGSIPGLTRDLKWGPRPGTFVVEVTAKEAELVLGSTAGPEFRDVTHGDPQGPAIVVPRQGLSFGSADVFGGLKEFERSMRAALG